MKKTDYIINQPVTSVGRPSYDPNALMNELLRRMQLGNDQELAEKLQLDEKLLTKIRERRLQLSMSMLLAMQERTGFMVAELRAMMGDKRRNLR